jgi:hypothetical protein
MDIYDYEIERLTANPSDIRNSWVSGKPLFQFICNCTKKQPPCPHGCPTVIRGNEVDWPAQTPELQELIINDNRIPVSARDIRVEDLPAFAEIQRKADTALGRTPKPIPVA